MKFLENKIYSRLAIEPNKHKQTKKSNIKNVIFVVFKAVLNSLLEYSFLKNELNKEKKLIVKNRTQINLGSFLD